jgi:hypothetical protein
MLFVMARWHVFTCKLIFTDLEKYLTPSEQRTGLTQMLDDNVIRQTTRHLVLGLSLLAVRHFDCKSIGTLQPVAKLID